MLEGDKKRLEMIKGQKKLTEERLRDIEAMIVLRFSGSDWASRFAEFRAENELRES